MKSNLNSNLKKAYLSAVALSVASILVLSDASAQEAIQSSPLTVQANFVKEKSLNQWVFVDSPGMRQMKLENDMRMARMDEARARGSLNAVDRNNQIQTAQSIQMGFAQDALRQFSRKEAKAFDGLLKEQRGNPALIAVGTVGAIYTGKTMRARISDSARAHARISARSKQANIGVDALGFVATVGYSARDKHMVSAVSRELFSNVRAVVESNTQREFKLQYGISF